jgi:molybdopterin-containing oxidoreductase family iron-sulfur binding subunit
MITVKTSTPAPPATDEPRATPRPPVEFEGVRRPGAAARRRYWKSLDELAQAPAFLEFLHREFPEQASMFEDEKGRREFLTLMGASLALAGLTACTKQPEERILPYVRQPETLVPGRPLFFATAASHDGYARGLLVESHEGRPTKVEGNPDHPASLGATDAFGQAHVLGLYDPPRRCSTSGSCGPGAISAQRCVSRSRSSRRKAARGSAS